MARTSVTSQSVVRTGLNSNLTAPAAEGDIIDPGNVILWVNNGAGTSMTVTVQSNMTVDGLTLPNQTVTVPAAGVRLIGPFPARTFAQSADATVGPSRVLVDYSSVASVTRAVISL